MSARKSVEELMQHYDLHADPDAITGTLSVAAQQKIEILKALARRTRLLIRMSRPPFFRRPKLKS